MTEQSKISTVNVGKEKSMIYAFAGIAKLSRGEKEVMFQARGKAISKAVDAVEILKNRFVSNLKVKSIVIGTENLTIEDGSKITVSTIKILVSI